MLSLSASLAGNAMPDLPTAAEYRRLAAVFRDRAPRVPLPSLHETYLKLAVSYELQAEQMEAAEQCSAPNHQDDGSAG
jgi:hypothetical protein